MNRKILLMVVGFIILTSPLFAATHGILGHVHPTYRVDSWYIDANYMLVPGYTNVFDIGTSSLKPRDFFLGRNASITGTLGVTGATTFTAAIIANGAVTLGDAVTDITTFTGKIAGATPLSFDGATANTVYTIFAISDPTSASKTITFPAVTGTVMLGSAATVITAGATPTLTVGVGNQLFTDTITTDDQNQTITFSAGGSAGDRITIIFITDTGGSLDEIITFHTTLVNSTGTLTLANLTAGRYVIEFVSDGTVWNEVSRTGAQS